MKRWPTTPVGEVLIPVKAGRDRQILASDIRRDGQFPVIDQGRAFIAGYSDDAARLVRDGLPLVIFGDHTLCLKYVDFPFIVGADGTKLLKPREDLFDTRFFYYALRHLNLPGRGYNRHFSLLKEAQIVRPPVDEQVRVAHILHLSESNISAHEASLRSSEDLKKALLSRLLSSASTPGWAVKTVSQIANLKSGGTPSRSNAAYWNGGTIPWVKTGEVDNCTIVRTGESITEAGLKHSSAKLFPTGTLLMAMYGQGVTRGKVALLGIEAATNQASVAFFPKDGVVSSEFLYYYFQSRYEDIRAYGHGANQKNLSADIIGGFPIAYPEDRDEQERITNLLRVADGRILSGRTALALATEVFDSLLRAVMTQEIVVDQVSSMLEIVRVVPVDAHA